MKVYYKKIGFIQLGYYENTDRSIRGYGICFFDKLFWSTEFGWEIIKSIKL